MSPITIRMNQEWILLQDGGVYKNATVASPASETPINLWYQEYQDKNVLYSPLHILFHTFLVRVNHGKNSKMGFKRFYTGLVLSISLDVFSPLKPNTLASISSRAM